MITLFLLLHRFVPIGQRHLAEKWAAGILFPGPPAPRSCCSGICKKRQAEAMLQKINVTLPFVSTVSFLPSPLPFQIVHRHLFTRGGGFFIFGSPFGIR